MEPTKTEKKVVGFYFCCKSPNPPLKPKRPDDVTVEWSSRDEACETMDLERWDIIAANISSMVQAWRFSSYREPNLQPAIMDQAAVAETKLPRKYKEIRFSDRRC